MSRTVILLTEYILSLQFKLEIIPLNTTLNHVKQIYDSDKGGFTFDLGLKVRPVCRARAI